MKIPSRGSPEFWQHYRALPESVRHLAQKNYGLWREDASHPSLRFKRIRKPWWSVRVGLNFRAVGAFDGDLFIWEWIGTHEDYDQRY